MKTFNEMSKEVKLTLLEATLEGKTIEAYIKGHGWRVADKLSCVGSLQAFSGGVCYRVQPEKRIRILALYDEDVDGKYPVFVQNVKVTMAGEEVLKVEKM